MAGLNASVVFPNGLKKISEGTFDFDDATIRCVLVKKSFGNTTLTATNLDGFDFLDDIPSGDRSKNSAFPVLTTNDIVIDGANNHVNYGSGTTAVSFTVVTNGTSCRGVVFFKSSSGTESQCPIISYSHFNANVTADGGTVTVTLNADGIFRLSY